jgi:solute carrier family 25 citrate transporter 1
MVIIGHSSHHLSSVPFPLGVQFGASDSLYRGLTPTLIGSVPKAGIRFGLNAVIKDKLRDENGKLTVGKNFVAGLGAGVTEALVIVAPVETVKTKVIELNMSFVKGLKHIIKAEGFGGIYQGVGSS